MCVCVGSSSVKYINPKWSREICSVATGSAFDFNFSNGIARSVIAHLATDYRVGVTGIIMRQ